MNTRTAVVNGRTMDDWVAVKQRVPRGIFSIGFAAVITGWFVYQSMVKGDALISVWAIVATSGLMLLLYYAGNPLTRSVRSAEVAVRGNRFLYRCTVELDAPALRVLRPHDRHLRIRGKTSRLTFLDLRFEFAEAAALERLVERLRLTGSQVPEGIKTTVP